MIIKRNLIFSIFSVLLSLLLWTGCGKQGIEIKAVSVDAPFEMPQIAIPSFNNCKKYTIKSFGAQQGDKVKTTKAIQNAILAANKNGGGRVVIPKGEWRSGKIHLQSHVDLHLENGAVLRFSGDPQDYLPPVFTSWAGIECYNYSPLIYAYNCENIAVSGKGRLKAEMSVWRDWFVNTDKHLEARVRLYKYAAEHIAVKNRQMIGDSAHLRPHFIQFNRCKGVLLQGIDIVHSPFWVVHPYMCENVVIRNIRVQAQGHNNDGVDIEMSRAVLIENCVFNQGDDAIAIKAGRNQEGWRLDMPSQDIVVRNCEIKNGHQLMAIGSELSAGVENVYLHDCKISGEAENALRHLVYIKTNERRGGFVRNIYAKNIRAGNIGKGMLGIDTDVMYWWRDIVPTYEIRLTPIEDIFLENIHADSVEYVSMIQGSENLPVKNVVLKNVSAVSSRQTPLIHEHVFDFQWNNGQGQ